MFLINNEFTVYIYYFKLLVTLDVSKIIAHCFK